MMFFFFELDYVVDYINIFLYIEPSLLPQDEAYMLVVNDHFDVFLNSVGMKFLRFFALVVIKEIGLNSLTFLDL